MNKRISILSILPLLILASCSGGNVSSTSDTSSTPGSDTPSATKTVEENPEHFYVNSLHKINVTDTQNIFVKNSESDYKIVLEDDPCSHAIEGAEFIVGQVLKCTGFSLPIIHESDMKTSFSSNSKYIIYGCRDLFTEAGLSMPTDDLYRQGYYIKSYGTNVFIEPLLDIGFHLATLSFLKHSIGYEMISDDCVIYEKSGETMPNMEIIEKPDYQQYYQGDAVSMTAWYGMGFTDFYDVMVGPNGELQHNALTYLPVVKFYKDHPKWFYHTGETESSTTQICYLAKGDHEEFLAMAKEIANQQYALVQEYPGAIMCNFSQMDNVDYCLCDACREDLEKYGTRSHACMLLSNQIDNYLQEMLQADADKTGEPKRLVYNSFNPYYGTEKAPVKKDENGNYVPIDDTCTLNPTVIVYPAVVGGKYNHTLYSDMNSYERETYEQWASLATAQFIWLYETCFHSYLYPYNTYEKVAYSYRYLLTQKSIFMYDISQYNQGYVTCFGKYKEYLDAKLLFNTSLSNEYLKNRFFDNFYGEASPYMLEYYNQIVMYMEYVQEAYPEIVAGILWDEMENVDIWPKKLLDQWLGIMDKAYAAIEPLKVSNPERYETIKKYIKLETIFPRWALLKLHSGYYKDDDFKEMASQLKVDCAVLGIIRNREGTFIADQFSAWGV